MFLLYKTIETPEGELQTLVHGVFHLKTDAQQIGDNLRALYPWVRSVRVEADSAAHDAELPLSRKKMASSISPNADQQRKIS